MYITIRAMIDAASRITGMPADKITGPSRKRDVVRIRAAIAHLARRERQKETSQHFARFSATCTAKALGRADHSSIINLTYNWAARCVVDPTLQPLAEAIYKEMLYPAVQAEDVEGVEGVEEITAEVITALRSHRALKPKNDFLPEEGDEGIDAGHRFHVNMISASEEFGRKLRAAQGACNP